VSARVVHKTDVGPQPRPTPRPSSVPHRTIKFVTNGDFILGGYPLSGLVRRVRRTADLSQRELAKQAEVAPSAVAAIETGTMTPRIDTLQRILNAAGYRLTVVDSAGRLVIPLVVWDGVCDGAGRRYPAHLDTILDPEYEDWWASIYGLARPPETFRRSRVYRDAQRKRSQWEVRVAKHRFDPPPPWPAQVAGKHAWERAREFDGHPDGSRPDDEGRSVG
jgi:transcriptional regulator with XRE-family HTH domain